MAFEVVFSSRADKQLEKLQRYLAKRFYPANAERYVQRLTQACRSLGKAPYRGTMREDLSPELRTVGFERSATIYFAVVGEQVVILSICYGGRLFQSESE